MADLDKINGMTPKGFINMLIDTHAHLYWDSFQDDLDQVINRALQAGIAEIINIGVDVKTSKIAAKLKSDKIKIYSTIGIHPEEAIKYFSDHGVSIHEDIEQLMRVFKKSVSNNNRIVGVGECGLDFAFSPDFMKTPNGITLSADKLRSLQIKLFQAQIDLAKKLNLPLIVHCRDDRSQNPENSECWDKVLEMLGNCPAILHCYSGLPKTTNLVLNSSNLLVSFAGNLTYPKNEYLREAVKLLPLEKILLETDSPFLAPQGKRGQRNEPSFMLETAKFLAGLKGISLEELTRQITQNAHRIFNLTS